MKRSLVVILTIAVLLFAFSGFAAASEQTEQELAAQRLLSFGVIEGFPDGTLRLTQEITRAEFARISVLAQGLGDAATALQGTITQFSDVGTNLWFTGWINVASAHGIIVGYPDGTFRPNNNITYAEAVTMILRTLGYNDNLPGAWPFNYMVKGADLGITTGLVTDAGANAVRGNVFAMLNRALDNSIVRWNPQTARFDYVWTVDEGVAYTLLQWMLRARERTQGFVTDTFHTDRSLDANEIRINGVIYRLACEELDANWLLGQEIRAFHNGAPAREVFLVDPHWGTLDRDIFIDKLDERFVANTDRDMDLLARDDNFRIAPGARFVVFGSDGRVDTRNAVTGTYSGRLNANLSEGTIGRFIFERGEIVFGWVIDPRTSHYAGVVTAASASSISYFTQEGDARTLNLNRFNEVFVLDAQLRTSDVDQINENSVIYAWENNHTELFIVVVNNTVEGTLTSANSSRVIVGGTNVSVRNLYTTVSDDGNDTVEFYREGSAMSDLVGDMIDEAVVVLRDLTGHARHITTETAGVSGTIFGIVTGMTGSHGITVRESDGRSAVSRTFANADDFWFIQERMAFGANNRQDFLFVRYQIDRNGNIRDGSLVIVGPVNPTAATLEGTGLTALNNQAVTRINERSRFIVIGGNEYTVNNRTAIMAIDLYPHTPALTIAQIRNSIQALNWGDLRDGDIAGDVRASILADGSVAQFIVITRDPGNQIVGNNIQFGVAHGNPERATGVTDWRTWVDVTDGDDRMEVRVRANNTLPRHSLVSFRVDSNNEARRADYGPISVGNQVYGDGNLFRVTRVQGTTNVTLERVTGMAAQPTNVTMADATGVVVGSYASYRIAPGAAIWMTVANGDLASNSGGQRFDVGDFVLVLKDSDDTIQAALIVNNTRANLLR